MKRKRKKRFEDLDLVFPTNPITVDRISKEIVKEILILMFIQDFI